MDIESRAEIGNRPVGAMKSSIAHKPLDLNGECSQLNSRNEWLLFSVETNLIADSERRTFFETSKGNRALRVLYEGGLVKALIPSETDNKVESTELPIRWVRQTTADVLLVAITPSGIRTGSKALDTFYPWPKSTPQSLNCGQLRIGDDIREVDGSNCSGCDISLRFSIGSSNSELNEIFERVTGTSRYNRLRIAGFVLVVGGALLMLSRPLRESFGFEH